MINPPFVRSPYNYDVTAASEEAAYVETMPSLTVQSQTEDADLNIMMQRFGVTGQLPENPRLPSYGDFSHITDYHSALRAIREADAAFGEFPAEIRSQFENNPQRFVDFVEDPGNIETVRKWFPQESFNVESTAANATSGAASPPSSSAASPGGARAASSDGGTSVPK